MIVDKSEKKEKRLEIDLSGPEGNAFVILGYVKSLGTKLGMSEKRMAEIRAEMMSGDYENLINVFDREFGNHVIMYGNR